MDLLVRLTDQDWGYTAHDAREYRNLRSLVPYIRDRVIYVLLDVNRAGFSPYVYEGKRTILQQLKHYRNGTSKTMFSKHLTGKAVDIADRKRAWDASPDFWATLKLAYTNHGMWCGLDWDRAHGEYRGSTLK